MYMMVTMVEQLMNGTVKDSYNSLIHFTTMYVPLIQDRMRTSICMANSYV